MEITLLDEIYARAWEEGKRNICLKVWSLKKKHGLFSNKLPLDNSAPVEVLLEQVTEALNRQEETHPNLRDQRKEPLKQPDTQKVSALPLHKATLKARMMGARGERKEKRADVSIRSFLPQEVSKDAVEHGIQRAIEKTNARGPQDMSAVMAFQKRKFPRRLDMMKVPAQLKTCLAHKI